MHEPQKILVWSSGGEDPREKEMATHASILAWKMPWTEERGRIQPTGSKRVGRNWACTRRASAAAAKLLQSCPTLCDPIDGSPPGSPVPGIVQTRALEWVAISFSNAWKVKSEKEVAQLCPTLGDPTDGSPPGSPVPGILQPRTLEWVAISFSNACKWKVKEKLLSRVRPLATLWTAAYQAPPSMRFSRKEYWSGVPLPSPT